MTCGSCGATIADKAIICYRCGRPTSVTSAPAAEREATPPGRWWPVVVWLGLAALIAGGLVWFISSP